MFEYFRRGTVQKIEADLTALESRRDLLQAKFDAAAQALDEARRARVDVLLNDDDSPSARAAIEKKLLGCERDHAALADAAAEIENRIADAKTALIAARDCELRERAAVSHDKAALAVDVIAGRLDKKIGELIAIFHELAASIPHGAGLPRYGLGGDRLKLTPNESARAITAEALFARCPELFEITGTAAVGTCLAIQIPVMYRRNDFALSSEIPKHDSRVKFLRATEAAAANIAEPLRQAATAIREGKLDPDKLFDPISLRPVVVELPSGIEGKTIVLLKPVKFKNHIGNVETHQPGEWWLPLAAAERALEIGAAVLPGSQEARELYNKRRRAWPLSQPGASPQEPKPPVDLQIDIQRMRADEFLRLNGSDNGETAQ